MERKPNPPRSPRGKRAELARWIEGRCPVEIGESDWAELRNDLSPISTGYLRKLLRETGLPLSPLIEGVRQDTLDTLEESLVKMLDEYERGDRERQTAVRRLVIEAKDHAKWAMKSPEKRAEKEEMVLWMLTWLENPPLFRQWIRLRRNA